MRRISLVLACVLWAGTANADSSYSLYSWMSDDVSDSPSDRAYALGFLTGVVRGAGTVSKWTECIPSGVQWGTMEAVVMRWGRQHVTQQHQSANVAILIALREAYCPPVSASERK